LSAASGVRLLISIVSISFSIKESFSIYSTVGPSILPQILICAQKTLLCSSSNFQSISFASSITEVFSQAILATSNQKDFFIPHFTIFLKKTSSPSFSPTATEKLSTQERLSDSSISS
jgi:hypothetical protein